MHGEYAGRNWKQVKREMRAERQAEIAARKESDRQRRLAARLRREEVERQEEERPRVQFIAGKVGNRYFGRV